MDTKFNFKSAICTSREQSERLLALGLKPETADMHWYKPAECEHDYWFEGIGDSWATSDIPAWSLHRLIEMMPSVIYREGRLDYYLNVNRDGVIYDRMGIACIEYIYDNLFDNVVLCIEWLIKEGYFNKEYLEE